MKYKKKDYKTWNKAQKAKFLKIAKEHQEMVALVDMGDAEGFHVGRFPAGHQPTDFERWAGATSAYEVSYQECYEPYVIGHRALFPRYDERFRGYGMNKIQHLYACHCRGLRFVVEPLVFVVAAEHTRSESWRKMYEIKTEPLVDQATASQPSVKNSSKDNQNEHAVRVAMVWQRFKEEIATGHAPDLMVASDTPHVVVRRKAKTAWQARAASTFAKTRPSAARAKGQAKDQTKQLDALAHCVSRLATLKVV